GLAHDASFGLRREALALEKVVKIFLYIIQAQRVAAERIHSASIPATLCGNRDISSRPPPSVLAAPAGWAAVARPAPTPTTPAATKPAGALIYAKSTPGYRAANPPASYRPASANGAANRGAAPTGPPRGRLP